MTDKKAEFELEEWISWYYAELSPKLEVGGDSFYNSMLAHKAGIRLGFRKACAVILEEAKDGLFCYLDDAKLNFVVPLSRLESIIKRIQGE